MDDNEIRLSYTDRNIDDILAGVHPVQIREKVLKRFNQGEEFFLSLQESFTVPHFPIHHDVRQPAPSAAYLSGMRDFVTRIAGIMPSSFEGMTYFFDPTDVLKPCFYRLYRIQDALYLYLLRIDLLYRVGYGEIIERGTNDITSSYRSRNLFLESELIPIREVVATSGRPEAFMVRQTVSQTWIGETGHGYTAHGIWMDSELTKFFSKLILPAGRRSYPFYPFTCRYKTVCMEVPDPAGESRKRSLPYLHRVIGFLVPRMEEIQQSLREQPFSEEISAFVELKKQVQPQWSDFYRDLKIRPYLNADELKEYEIEF